MASSRRTVPGTPTLAPPKIAVAELHRPPAGQEAVGLGGGGRGLASVVGLELLGGGIPVQQRIAPPPMPDDCGSTRFSTSCTAIAASAALPPSRSISQAGLDRVAGWRQRPCADLAVTAARADHPQVVAASGCGCNGPCACAGCNECGEGDRRELPRSADRLRRARVVCASRPCTSLGRLRLSGNADHGCTVGYPAPGTDACGANRTSGNQSLFSTHCDRRTGCLRRPTRPHSSYFRACRRRIDGNSNRFRMALAVVRLLGRPAGR